jgi:xylulose-5-phosphate/fructose-6-phosphate phosphoketolase
MSANPYANGGLLRKDLEMPDFRNYCLEVPKPGQFEAGKYPSVGSVSAC